MKTYTDYYNANSFEKGEEFCRQDSLPSSATATTGQLSRWRYQHERCGSSEQRLEAEQGCSRSTISWPCSPLCV